MAAASGTKTLKQSLLRRQVCVRPVSGVSVSPVRCESGASLLKVVTIELLVNKWLKYDIVTE